MNYHSVCLHVLADSIRRYNMLSLSLSLLHYTHMVACRHIPLLYFYFFFFLLFMAILSCSTLLVSQCRFDIGVLVFVPWVITSSCLVFDCLSFEKINLPKLESIPLPCVDPFYTLRNFCFSTFFFRVQNAEVLCLGLVSVAVFMLVMPLFKATGGILLQMAPLSVPTSALSKCWRQVIPFFQITGFQLSAHPGTKKKKKEKRSFSLKCINFLTIDYYPRRCIGGFSSSFLGISPWSRCWLCLNTGEFLNIIGLMAVNLLPCSIVTIFLYIDFFFF